MMFILAKIFIISLTIVFSIPAFGWGYNDPYPPGYWDRHGACRCDNSYHRYHRGECVYYFERYCRYHDHDYRIQPRSSAPLIFDLDCVWSNRRSYVCRGGIRLD
jgi:hypothetical protein